MSSLLDLCDELFGTNDLYEVLGVSNTATNDVVKKAYYKAALKYHPDRVKDGNKQEATKTFQGLGRVYSLLSDLKRRKIYDQTGDVDEEAVPGGADGDWGSYWRLVFPKLTEKDIDDFENKYKASEEERNDLIKYYKEFKGDMDGILPNMMCSTIDDEPRYRAILEELIESKELKRYRKFKEDKKKTQKRKAKAAAEAKEVKEWSTENASSLTALIQRNQNSRHSEAESFLSNLEAKYAQPAKKARNKKKK